MLATELIIYCVPDASPITVIYATSVIASSSLSLLCHETYCRFAIVKIYVVAIARFAVKYIAENIWVRSRKMFI